MKKIQQVQKWQMFVFAFVFGSASANAGVNLGTVPLQTGNSVEPNVMFIIDDSGSMHLEIMPEEIIRNYTIGPNYIFPRVDGIYGADDKVNAVPIFEDGLSVTLNLNETATAAYFRSSTINKLYYNPAITYTPWRNADNSGPYVSWGGNTGNSPPTAAYHHPTRTEKGSINLTVDQTKTANWVVCSSTSASSCVNQGSSSKKFYPAVYYTYHGNTIFSWSRLNFNKTEIRSSQNKYSGEGRSSRTDCSNGECTYEQEIQNFANWYTYYRSRLLASQAGIGAAFSQQSSKIRVGFAAINAGSTSIDGVNTSKVVKGVRGFSGSDRASIFNELYGRIYPNSGTPLRESLDAVGTYFSRKDSKGPWGENPGFGNESSTSHIVCRQNYAVLMTDGYWTGSAGTGNNQDGSAGSLIQRPSGSTAANFTYQPVAPFSDSIGNTLADYAMKYWKADLRDDLDNRVPATTENPAFWQHMVTFGVSLGVTGTISPISAFNAIASNSSIAWPDPNSSDSAKIDDLLHAAVNSRGGFFSAADPNTFAYELSQTLSQIVARVSSASNLVGATSILETNKQIFQGRFFSGDWSGDLWGYDIANNTTPNWKASEQLNSRDWTTRKIFYSDDTGNGKGKAFSGAIATLSSSQVDYIRGDRSKELNKPGGTFRVRKSILGDIANSSPFYVGAPENKFYERFSSWDQDELERYPVFLNENKSVAKAVYVGSNDGMLHAFNADNGQELFGYVPYEMLPKLPALTNKDYQHQYYVDGSATVAQAYVDGKWRNILVGTNGRGGKNVFALDVTKPSAFTKDQVLWEISIPELGNYTGQAVIAKLGSPAKDAEWYAILGNGVNSQNHTATLIMIKLKDGSVEKRTAHTGSASQPNGLFQPVGLDVDNTGVVSKVFAGDLQGNIWEFDMADKPSNSKVAYSGTPLFIAKDAQGNRQAITGGLTVSMDSTTGNSWLFFGSGKYLEQKDQTNTQAQSWYGLILPLSIDTTTTGSGNGNAGGGGKLVTGTTPISGRSDLAQRIITNVGNARSVSDATSLDGKRGWYMDLPDTGERVVSTPQMIGSTLVLNTIVPKPDQCSPEGFGYVMAIDPYLGTRLKRNFFDVDGNKVIDDNDKITVNSTQVPASGLRFSSAPGQPIFYQNIMKVGLENASVIDVVVDTDLKVGRVSWREVLN